MTAFTKYNFRFIILHTINLVRKGFYNWEEVFIVQHKMFAHKGH